jgi:hypothetical protein
MTPPHPTREEKNISLGEIISIIEKFEPVSYGMGGYGYEDGQDSCKSQIIELLKSLPIKEEKK